MADQIYKLMTKYLQVLAGAAGRETENLRAKMAWHLAQDFFNSVPKLPITVEELADYLEPSFKDIFSFCEELKIKQDDSGRIKVTVKECFLKKANQKLEEEYQLNLCPIDPFLNFVISRSVSQNASFAEHFMTDDGCVMEFLLNSRGSCSRY